MESIARALVNIYQEKVDIDHDIEENLYRDTVRIISDGINNGYADAIEQGTQAPTNAFRDAFRHSAEVFSAFRVHKMQNDIAALMLDGDGHLKSFQKFVKDVSPYIEHRNRAWLQTEYDTAVLRAQNAAEWNQFMEEKDVYPNLEWVHSSSPNPGADHMPFWGVVLSVDDPFWEEHKPGDRWNCKCELRQTEKGSVEPPTGISKKFDASAGLESNPFKAKEVFSDKHPYFPTSCSSCPFVGNKLVALAHDLAGGKHCMKCRVVNRCIERVAVDAKKREFDGVGKAYEKTFFDKKTGGYLVTDKKRIEVAKKNKQEKVKYEKEKDMCLAFARAGHKVQHLSEQSGVSSCDVLFDGIPADLKSTKSHNNIAGYAKHALRSQGASIILFRFDKMDRNIKNELLKLRRKGVHGWFYVKGEEAKMHKI